MTSPEELPRERASDVPEGAEVRADGSYVVPADSLSEEQKLELLPPEQTDEEREREEAKAQADADRELAALDSVQREQGTVVQNEGTQVASYGGAE
jgi:hypothetical protein